MCKLVVLWIFNEGLGLNSLQFVVHLNKMNLKVSLIRKFMQNHKILLKHFVDNKIMNEINRKKIFYENLFYFSMTMQNIIKVV